MADSTSGLGEAIGRELAARAGNSAELASSSAQLLQEFSRADSDSLEVGLSKAMARVLIGAIGEERASTAIATIRERIAGAGPALSRRNLARGRPAPHVLSPAARGAEIPAPNFSQGLAAVRAAIAGRSAE